MRLHLRKIWPALLLLASASTYAADHRVTVGGTYQSGPYTYPLMSFSPSTIDANVGDTITFVNAGGFHNVAADDGSFRCANGCDGAGGNGTPSDSAWTSTVTLDAAGDIGFHCEVHAGSGMTGVIHVAGGNGGGGGGGGGTTNVPITAGFSGAWYDPAQSGHGILIEVLSSTQILAWWFTFNPDGTQQSWFGNVGAINGTTASIAAVQTQGGQWIPNFDPSNITQPIWGTLTFTFTDCNHGRVDFNSSVTGYGTGHMNLTRLTQPAGLTCP